MCNQPWGESSGGNITLAYLYISVSGGPTTENWSLLLSHASHLRLPAPRLCTLPQPAQQETVPTACTSRTCEMEEGGSRCLLHFKQVRHTLCYRKGQREKSAFWPGFGSYQAALFYFHWVWLAPGRESQRNTWEILWYSHNCASLLRGEWKYYKRLPLLFKASSALCFPVWKQMELKSFKMLCYNHSLSPPRIHPQPAKWQPIIVQPEPLDFPRRSLSPQSCFVTGVLCFFCCISKRLLEISC